MNALDGWPIGAAWVGVVKSLELTGAGPVDLVPAQKVQFFRNENPFAEGSYAYRPGATTRVAAASLKALDPKRPIREADIRPR
jgi:hypothetical protein